MASYFDEIARNRRRSLLLFFLLALFFVFIVYMFSSLLLGFGLIGLILSVSIVAIYSIAVYHGGNALVLKLSGAKETKKEDYPVLYTIISGLAGAAQVPMPKVYVIDDANPNAFATGKNKNNASIAVTAGLLRTMNSEELRGVLGHEISHIANNDIQYMMVAVIFAGAIGIMAAFARNFLLFGGMNMRGRNGDGAVVILAVVVVLGIIAPLIALLVRLAISRRREYMADANGARLTRNPKALADALEKIKRFGERPESPPVKNATEATASMYFSSPFKKESMKNIFSTHPPIEERIRRLRSMY